MSGASESARLEMRSIFCGATSATRALNWSLIGASHSAVAVAQTLTFQNPSAEDGRWTFPPPLGYRAGLDATGAKTIIPDEHSAPLIAQAFEEFATGLHTREQVLRKVTQLGLRTKKASPSVHKRSHKRSGNRFMPVGLWSLSGTLMLPANSSR